jgi:hypothetical protein
MVDAKEFYHWTNFSSDASSGFTRDISSYGADAINIITMVKLWDNQVRQELSLNHRYRKMKNRLLKVCYVPATSTGLPRLLFSSFFMRPLTVVMKQTRQAGCAIKQSILLKCLGLN